MAKRTTHVDLRNRRRITLTEAKYLLDAVTKDDGSKRLAEKLREAIELAEHACPDRGQCPTCGKWPGNAKLARERRAKDLEHNLGAARWTRREPPYPGGAA